MWAEKTKTRAILEYIRNNPGRSEGELIRYLEGKQICSKDTTRKYVKLLKENDDIIIEKDKRQNNKTHHLIINNKSEFNQIDTRLSYVEKELDRLTNQPEKQRRGQRNEENWWFQMDNNMWILQMVLLRMTDNKSSLQQDSEMLYRKIIELMVRITQSQKMARRKGKSVLTSVAKKRAIGLAS
jgi:hypothetical protein